jgi:tellurite resistance protein TerC
MDVSVMWWVGVVGVILGMLAIDLFFFHREAHEVSPREAGIWTAVWITLGLGFGGIVAWQFGLDSGAEYLAGYVIEKSLAVDNIFVFAVIFSAFSIPARFQHRVLFWGVVGALLMRAGFIAAGAVLLDRFHWTIYLFGGLLVVTAWRMWIHRDHKPDPANNPAIRWMQRHIPMSSELDGQNFFTVQNGKRLATPLLAALVAVEFADVVFAVDSIPAIFAVTSEPFLVFTSNAFAILGLRSMYFFLAGLIERFRHLSAGLAAVLAFVGIKMLLIDTYKIPILVSLGVIISIIGVSVIVSLLQERNGMVSTEAPASSLESSDGLVESGGVDHRR